MKKTCALFFGLIPFTLFALPQGGNVKSGTAVFATDKNVLSVEVSDRAIIDYESFNIEVQERVEFIQPKSSSTLLNRVQGGDPSKILGNLVSNGKVFLVNPNGVYFGPDAVVDARSFIASTLDILNQDFLDQNYCFSLRPGTETAFIHNEGTLSALSGGVIALLAPQIVNEGTIIADIGQVFLASVEKVTIDFMGDGMLQFAVEGLMKEGGLAGKIALDRSSAQKILEDVVNADGFIVGAELIEKEGIIHLVANSRIDAEDITIIGANVEIEGALNSSWDMHIEAEDILCIRDRKGAPLFLHARRHLTMNSPFIDILAWENSDTFIGSNGNLTLVSDNPISADGNFFAGGDFSLLMRDGRPADFLSYLDPIVTSLGSVTFGTYSGASLKVEAAGNITCTGDITITMADANACSPSGCSGDPDCGTLTTTPVLILVAGTTPASMTCNSVTNSSLVFSGTTFSNPGGSGNTINFTQILGTTLSGFTSATFTGDIVSAGPLSISANDGAINLMGVTSGILTLSAGTGIITFDGVVTASNLRITSSGGINIGADITTHFPNAMVLFTGPITLTTDSILTLAGPPTFTSTIDGDFDFTLISGHTLIFQGSIGSITPLNNFSIQSYFQTDLTGLSITANDTITIENPTGGGPLTVGTLTAGSGGIALQANSALNLTANISSNNGPISFSFTAEPTITIESTLSINAGTSRVITVGPIVATAAGVGLTLESSGIDFGGNITTNNGAININGPFSLTEASVISSSGGTITFSAIINGAYDLTLNAGTGMINLEEVGMGYPPLSFNATGGSISLANNITTSAGPITINGPITLTGDSTLLAQGGEITLGGTVDGMYNFAVTANSQVITLDGALGSITPLLGFTAAGGSLVVAGDITAGGLGINMYVPITLIGSPIMSASDTGLILLNDTVNGMQALTLNANGVAINGAVGGITPLLSFNCAASGISLQNNITTNNGPIALNARTTLYGSSTLSSSGGVITLDGTVDGMQNFILNAGSGAIDINGAIGGITPLLDFSATGGSISLASNITTNDEPITIDGPLTLTGNVALSSSGGAITLDGTVDGAEVFILVAGTGSVTLNGAIGGVTPLDKFQVMSSSGIDLEADITTSTNAPFLLTGPITLTGDSAITTAGAPTFTSTIDGNFDFSLDPGGNTVVFGGDIGSITPLNAFFVQDYYQIDLSAIAVSASAIAIQSPVSNAMDLSVGELTAGNGGVVLQALDTMNLSGNITADNASISITFVELTPTVNLESTLVMDAGTDPAMSTITIGGPIVGTTAGVGLTLEGAGTISLQGDITTNDGAITIDGPLVLGQGLTLSSSNGAITLFTVDGFYTFTVDAGTGAVDFEGAIGSVTTISNFMATGGTITVGNDVTTLHGSVVLNAESIALGGDILTNNAPITFNGNLILDDTVTLTTSSGGSLTFEGTIDGAYSMNISSGAGLTTFNGDVGSVTALTAIMVSGSVNFAAASLTANTQSYTGGTFNCTQNATLTGIGDITFSEPITLSGGSLFILSTSLGNCSFESIAGTGLQNVGMFAGGTLTVGEMDSVGEIAGAANAILLNGEITAYQVAFASKTSILNAALPQPINLMSTSIFETQGSTIGSKTSPIDVNNPTGIVIAGAPSKLAAFSGTTIDNTIHIDLSNPPCPVIFNGTTIRACPTPPPPPSPPSPPPSPLIITADFPARDFYVPGIYSIYDTLASDQYFLPEIVDDLYTSPRHNPLFVTQKRFVKPKPMSRKIGEPSLRGKMWRS
jgi:filamentous hemagglutinin family protein